MKTARILLSLAAGLPLFAQDAEIRCIDGSRIRGTVLDIGTDRIDFEAPFLAGPVPLRLDKILDVGLPVHRGEMPGDHVAILTLTNGDTLKGELAGIDSSSITLRTSFAGDLSFRRAMVDRLEIQDRPDLIYAGPDGLDGWVPDEAGNWHLEDGEFRARKAGGISRELDLPDKVRFSFELSWRSSPRFNFMFFCDGTGADPTNSYDLAIQGGRYVQLHKRWSKDGRSGSTSLGNFANVPELVNKERCRIVILADRKTGRIRMLVNDRIVQDWSDPDPETGIPGGGIRFSTPENVQLRVSRIEVTSWDGTLEGRPPQQDEGFMNEEDTPLPDNETPLDPARIRLRNNDQIAGEVQGIEGGKARLKTSFGDVNLPVSRLRSFEIHNAEQREDPEVYQLPIRRNGDVRAWFPDGGHVTFRLLSTGGGKFTGDSQTFGQAGFDQKAFIRIEFNLYEPELDARRAARDSW